MEKEQKAPKENSPIKWLIIFFILLQIGLWTQTKEVLPDLAIVPEVASENSVKAISFGDEQFYFRVLGFEIQNAGDTFGRATPLKNYDYNKLSMWFYRLDDLDSTSNLIPSLASYFYSNTQRHSDNIYIVRYLVDHAMKDPGKKWWWLSQAVLIAKYKLKDKQLALDIAKKLAAAPGNLPIWARQMPAFILADMGEKEQSYLILKDIFDNYKNLPESEINFMYYFIQQQLKMLAPEELKEKQTLE